MRTLVDLSSQMKDLSGHVEATEDRQREVEAFHASLNTSRPARRRARPRESPVPHQDMAEEINRCVTKWMRQLPAYSGATAKEGSTSEEEDQPAPRKGKKIKSGIDRTGATTVISKVTWSHEVVYTSAGKSQPPTRTYQSNSL